MLVQIKAKTEGEKGFYDGLGATSFFELNRGGHFENVSLRIAKGIDYLTA